MAASLLARRHTNSHAEMAMDTIAMVRTISARREAGRPSSKRAGMMLAVAAHGGPGPMLRTAVVWYGY